jgi:uncharacterized Zn-finger protein
MLKKVNSCPLFYFLYFYLLSIKIFLKRFAYKHILQEHQNLHFGLKPHVCLFCDKKFAAKSNLIQHNRRHRLENATTINQNDTSKACNLCPKKYTFFFSSFL